MREEEKYIQSGINMPIHCEVYHRQCANPNSPPDIHYHKYCEIVLCLEGTCNCIIGTEKYSLKKGDLLFIESNAPHATGFFTDLTKYIVIKFNPSILLANEQLPSEYSYLHFLYKTDHCCNYFKNDKIKDYQFSFLFNRILNEWNEHLYGYEIALRAHILEVFLNIIRIWHKETPDTQRRKLSTAQEATLQKSIDYIEENLTTVSQESLAKAMNVSTSHLSRIFKNGLNSSFPKFVNSVKLTESEKLLLTTSMSITEIGEACGFSTSSYFISMFNSKHGTTPAKYRQKTVT